MQVIVCGWLIPADAAGKTLRYWHNPGGDDLRRATIAFRGEHIGGPVHTWQVARP